MFRTVHRFTTSVHRIPSLSTRFFSTSVAQRQLLFTDKHEWLRNDSGNNKGHVGISDAAQDKLGEITHMDLKINVGDEIKEGDVVAEIESVKAVSDVYSPASGRVTAINQETLDDPTIINQSAEDKGWIFEMEYSNFEAEKGNMMDKDAYAKFCAEEDN